VPVLQTRADRARVARSLSDASVCVPLGEADLVVVSQRTSGASTHPTRRTAPLHGNAVRDGGLVVHDELWHLMVCVPAGTTPCALTVARFHHRTHGEGASDLPHHLRPDGHAVRRRAPHQVTGRPENESYRMAILTFLAGVH